MNDMIDLLNNIDYNVSTKDDSYYNRFNARVPRVTEILSKMIHSDALMMWANSLGFKRKSYTETLEIASIIGTDAHKAIELFLKNKIKSENNIPFLGFIKWYDIVTNESKINVDILMVEEELVCDWFGGTLDALLNIGGRIYLIDFKTSNRVRYQYFLQLSAYRYMLKVSRNIDIDGVIVLQLNKNIPSFSEYILNFSIPNHLNFINQCEQTFMSLVYAFYNIDKCENQYTNIFKNNH